jgi:hypothetical protein
MMCPHSFLRVLAALLVAGCGDAETGEAPERDAGGSSASGGSASGGSSGAAGAGDAAGAGASGAGGSAGVASDAGSDEVLTLYMAPGGDDALDGSTPANAVHTLGRVQEILIALAPDRDVDVRIDQGSYSGQSVVWTWYHPAHALRFMPIDYFGGGIASIAGRPQFDGKGAASFFQLKAAKGENTNIELIYLEIRGYRSGGIFLSGDRNDFTSGFNANNRVFGCYFAQIGNLSSAGDAGYAGVDLVNSDQNEIANNHFVGLANQSSSAGLMHGVYLAHNSSNNVIRGNRFEGVSGDPIRARDYSNSNLIQDNRFFDAGAGATYSDWFCDMTTNSACTKLTPECPSWKNEFRDNEIHCSYSGGSISTFAYSQGESYVPPGCTDHATQGWPRLSTSGNTKSCP